ncbi:uncharacterized protein LOC143053961 isoform X3 [Mytilus galloprovincialis]|uniref:uncharacterized protein LOC143053961 isoform X3 n=1 Tax=Mytilus galloprovincialis TaxID=29158 RepID=UPI003F7C9FB1
MQMILLLGLFVGTAFCCSSDEYTCWDGTCKPGSYRCDSWADCSFGEDDLGCPGCDINRFKCANGLYCIIWWGVCDGEDDCGDGSDERGCSNISWNSYFSSKRGLTSSNAEKVVSRGMNKRGKVEAAGTNMHKKENEAQKVANKMEKLRLLSRGKDGK